jgi:alpha-beta hydrolase superfamily lysophospholipase
VKDHLTVLNRAPIPITFGPCFGWYHPPRFGQERNRGVVLCPAFGAEMLRTHRNMRLLAVELAELGMPVLRFDYPGTGDSLGDDAPDQLERSIDSIVHAVATLRHCSGAVEIALCGLRLGALLAAQAARRMPGEICRQVLLAPVVDGSEYVRELKLRERFNPNSRLRNDWVEVLGFSMHVSDLRQLEVLTLADALPAAHSASILVLETAADRLPAGPFRDRLAAAGTKLVTAPFEGYVEFAREVLLAATPLADFARVVAFLRDGATAGDSACTAKLDAAPTLEGDEFTEEPVEFGAARDLFGILCSPHIVPFRQPRPAVAILNTGSTHHVGDARYAVALARRLASQGVASLRVDLGGVGDSARSVDPALMGGGPDAYRRARVRLFGRSYSADVTAALDALSARGYDTFVLVGVCSGAKFALDTAFSDPRVLGLALGNLPSFGSISTKPRWIADMVRTQRDRVVLGEVQGSRSDLPHIVRVLLDRRMRHWLTEALHRTRSAIGRTLGRAIMLIARLAGIGEAARGLRVLRGLSNRNAQVLLIYSRDDPSLAKLESCFGPQATALTQISGMSTTVVCGGDHAFATAYMREAFVSEVERLMERLHEGNEVMPATAAFFPQVSAGTHKGATYADVITTV